MLRLFLRNNTLPIVTAILAYFIAGLIGWGWHKELLLGFLFGALAFGRYEHPDHLKNADMLRIAVGRFLNLHLRLDHTDPQSEPQAACKQSQRDLAKLMQYWFLKLQHTGGASSFGHRPTADDRAFLEKVEREVTAAFGTTNPEESGAKDVRS